MVFGIPKRRITRSIAIVALLLVVAAAAFVLWPNGKKPHPVYEQALKKATSHATVKEMLGGEISGSTPDVAETTANSARFEFYVFGDYGCANILTQGEKQQGQWKITALDVESIDGSGSHNLLR